MMLDIQHALATARLAARQAGEVMLTYYHGEPIQHTIKSNPIDIVTDADREAEHRVIATLQAAFPDHHLIGEESGHIGPDSADAEYRWYIDPIDGTTNFANRLPFFSASIALTDSDNIPLLGVVFNPVADELFCAVRGAGTTLNDVPIHVSSTATLQHALLASGFPYDQATNPDNNLAEWGRFAVKTRGLRRFGSAALDLCYVACGRLDGYWEQRINLWDFLAGALCVSEAGGTVTDYTGESPYGSHNTAGRVIASNGRLHEDILQTLRQSG